MANGSGSAGTSGGVTSWSGGGGSSSSGSSSQLPTFGAAGAVPAAQSAAQQEPMLFSGRYMSQPGFVQAPHQTGESFPVPQVPEMQPASYYLGQLDMYYNVVGYKPQYQLITNQLRQAGYLPPRKKGTEYDYSTVRQAYQNMLIGASWNTNMTPQQFLEAKVHENFAASQKAQEDANAAAAGAYKGPTSTVEHVDNMDAKAILNNALGTYLGRQATDAELAAFQKKLFGEESANPTVQTPNDATHTMTVQGGLSGTGRAQLAEDYAKSRDNYAETTADTTLMGWFMQALQQGGM